MRALLLLLPACTLPAPPRERILGRVCTADGRGVAGVTVRVRVDDREFAATSDPAGRFTLPLVRGAHVRLEAEARDYTAVSGTVSGEPWGEWPIETLPIEWRVQEELVPDLAGVEIALEIRVVENLRISGRILDADSGAPLLAFPVAAIRLDQVPQGYSAITVGGRSDSNGRFELSVSPGPADRRVISTAHSDYEVCAVEWTPNAPVVLRTRRLALVDCPISGPPGAEVIFEPELQPKEGPPELWVSQMRFDSYIGPRRQKSLVLDTGGRGVVQLEKNREYVVACGRFFRIRADGSAIRVP